jgi:capsular polysaccharide biosynthesis protein
VNQWAKKYLWNPIVHSARPRFCENILERAQQEKWATRKIDEPCAFDLRIPPELAVNEKDRELFEGQRHWEFPARYLACLPRASALGGLVKLSSGEFLNESDWRMRDFLASDISRSRYVRHQLDLEGDNYYLDLLFSGNYAHWLADELPRLTSALPHLPAATRFITSDPIQEFKSKSLAALGISTDRLVPVKGFYQIRCERLWYATPANDMVWNVPVLQQLRGSLLEVYARGNGAVSERLFVSRNHARLKRLANEDELLPLIKSYGFRIINLEQMPFAEQVKYFSSAKVILGAHGAGFTNLLFSTKAKFLELQDNLFAPRLWYWKWASMLGHDYCTMTGPVTKSKDWLDTDFTIHPDSLKEFLEDNLSSQGESPKKRWWVSR